MIGSHARHPAAAHPVTASKRAFRARIWLASAMWVPVLAANLGAIALALLLPVLDRRLDEGERPPISIGAAQQIFGALAAGMIMFAGITFSAVFVAAQLQTSSYSPRLAARLRRDPVIIAGLALPTATATYALFALAAIGRESDRLGRDAVPLATVVAGLLLLVVTLGGFVALVQRAFDLTQIGGILRSLMRRAHAVVEDMHPVTAGSPRRSRTSGATAGPARPHARAPAHDRPGSGLRDPNPRRHRDQGALAGGQRPHHGRPGPRPDRGPARRALPPPPRSLARPRRRRRAARRVPAATWTEYLELGLTEIRHYGTESIQIGRRLQAVYDRLAQETDDDAVARVELERRLLEQALDARFIDERERAIAGRPDRIGLGAGG
jgi:uncharacterized membrane protein